MENKLSKQQTHTCVPNSHPPALAMHKDSQTISKTKPKIRIIHVFAPQIIKTDIENFRELVQKITGKPSGEEYCKKKPVIASGTAGIDQESRSTGNRESQRMDLRNGGFWGLDQSMERVKEEIGFCSDESSARYLGEFSDLKGCMSELGEFPVFPLDGTQVQGFEDSQLI